MQSLNKNFNKVERYAEVNGELSPRKWGGWVEYCDYYDLLLAYNKLLKEKDDK